MRDFVRLVVPEVVSGRDARTLVGRSALNLGARRVLLVSDPGVAAAGWTEAARRSLAEAGVEVELFGEVTPNPRVAEVTAGATRYRESGANAIVVVGGGSPVDCAKGIAIVTANGGTISDYAGFDRVPLPIPPLICVPTTAGAGADLSQFAIVSDLERRVKFAVVSKAIVPDVSLIDPLPLTTQPPEVTAAAGGDALSHAVEALASTAASDLTTLLALEGARLLAESVPRALAAPADLDARAATMIGCFYAGVAFSNASLGAVHALAHGLGGAYDMAHGEAVSALLPHVVEFNFPAAPGPYRRLATALGLRLPPGDEAAAAELAGNLRQIISSCGLRRGLAALGAKRGDLGALAERAAEDPCMATNPRCPSPREVVRLYEKAL